MYYTIADYTFTSFDVTDNFLKQFEVKWSRISATVIILSDFTFNLRPETKIYI